MPGGNRELHETLAVEKFGAYTRLRPVEELIGLPNLSGQERVPAARFQSMTAGWPFRDDGELNPACAGCWRPAPLWSRRQGWSRKAAGGRVAGR